MTSKSSTTSYNHYGSVIADDDALSSSTLHLDCAPERGFGNSNLGRQDTGDTEASPTSVMCSLLPSDMIPLTKDTEPPLLSSKPEKKKKVVVSFAPAEDDFFDEQYDHCDCDGEAEIYLRSTIFQRAIPERMFALSLTMLLEIPVLLLISGGSDDLCQLIGRRKYQLLIGFLPLTSAISGNVGLQASTLTTRAISHTHVTTYNYVQWLTNEMGAAAYLGIGMGMLLGSIAFVASGNDPSFGITIFVAQLLSVVTAGFTGTLAPILFSFVFRRDSGKWGGPLETAVQDIVGSFAMVVVSYHILKLLGPGPVGCF